MKQVVYSLFLCTAAFAEEPNKDPSQAKFKQGDDTLPSETFSGYNVPAGVLLKNNDDALVTDLFFDASFLYYYAKQDGFNLANSGQIINPSGSTYLVTSDVSNGTILSQDFQYKPGFKAGLGANFYEWTLSSEYTWIRQTTKTSKHAPTPHPTATGIGVWISNDWFEQTLLGQALSGTKITSKWHLAMDLADLTAGRPLYEGKNLTLSPFFGLRAAWIRQKFNVDLTTSSLLTGEDSTTVKSMNKSRAWGLGPRTGFSAACLLGQGFRLEGNTAVSLLYTEFTHIYHTEDPVLSGSSDTIGVSQNNYSTVRPELEMGLGLGWGRYLAKERYHIDFSASYDFAIFWEQNMIRKMLDETISGVGSAANNLYLHGLTIKGGFNF